MSLEASGAGAAGAGASSELEAMRAAVLGAFGTGAVLAVPPPKAKPAARPSATPRPVAWWRRAAPAPQLARLDAEELEEQAAREEPYHADLWACLDNADLCARCADLIDPPDLEGPHCARCAAGLAASTDGR